MKGATFAFLRVHPRHQRQLTNENFTSLRNKYGSFGTNHLKISEEDRNYAAFDRVVHFHNPFNSGLIKEDIRTGMFALKPDISQIAVMELDVTSKQFDTISEIMDDYWEHRDQYGFNFLGLASMLLCAKGVTSENRFFCSQWVATVLRDSGIDLFDGKNPKDIRPFDFYETLQDHIVYEGLAVDYSEYNSSPISANSNSSYAGSYSPQFHKVYKHWR